VSYQILLPKYISGDYLTEHDWAFKSMLICQTIFCFDYILIQNKDCCAFWETVVFVFSYSDVCWFGVVIVWFWFSVSFSTFRFVLNNTQPGILYVHVFVSSYHIVLCAEYFETKLVYLLLSEPFKDLVRQMYKDSFQWKQSSKFPNLGLQMRRTYF